MVLLVVGSRRESWVCQLWAETAVARGRVTKRKLGLSTVGRNCRCWRGNLVMVAGLLDGGAGSVLWRSWVGWSVGERDGGRLKVSVS